MSNTPLEQNGINLDAVLEKVNALPSAGGITPTGSITLTEENTYDVTNKATAVVDFSTTRANLAEAVTAKGVDTLPTSSFDTIATNIGLISGGLPSSIKELNAGIITFNQDYKVSYTDPNCAKIPHGLSEIPNIGILYEITRTQKGRPDSVTLLGGGADVYHGSALNISDAVVTGGGTTPAWHSIVFDATNIKIGVFGSDYYIHAGSKYFWLAAIADYTANN